MLARFILSLSLLCAFPLHALGTEAKTRPMTLPDDAVWFQGEVSVYSVRMVAIQLSSSFNDVHLFINSPGGDMNAAQWLVNQFDQLRAQGKTINCYAGNYVASAAFFIYLHCDNRYALKASRLFPHKIHVLFNRPVLPSDLIEIGIATAMEQEVWDNYGREVTGMTEADYKEFRDSDDKMWPITKVQEKSKKHWFKVVDYYMIRMVR